MTHWRAPTIVFYTNKTTKTTTNAVGPECVVLGQWFPSVLSCLRVEFRRSHPLASVFQGKVKKSKRSGANLIAIVPPGETSIGASDEDAVAVGGAPTVPGIMKGVRYSSRLPPSLDCYCTLTL